MCSGVTGSADCDCGERREYAYVCSGVSTSADSGCDVGSVVFMSDALDCAKGVMSCPRNGGRRKIRGIICENGTPIEGVKSEIRQK